MVPRGADRKGVGTKGQARVSKPPDAGPAFGAMLASLLSPTQCSVYTLLGGARTPWPQAGASVPASDHTQVSKRILHS